MGRTAGVLAVIAALVGTGVGAPGDASARRIHCHGAKCLHAPPIAVPSPTGPASLTATQRSALRSALKHLANQPLPGLTSKQRRFIRRRLGVVPKKHRHARAAAASDSVQGPPDDEHVGSIVSFSDTQKDAGDGARGKASGRQGGFLDRCPRPDTTLHGTYDHDLNLTADVSKDGAEGHVTLSELGDGTYVAHAGEDGVVHAYEMSFPHFRLLRRIELSGGDGHSVKVYGQVIGSIRMTVVDGARTDVTADLRVVGDFASDDTTAYIKGFLRAAQYEAEHEIEGADIACNWYDVKLDSDVNRTADNGGGGFHYHVAGELTEIHTPGGFQRPLTGGTGHTTYLDASGTASEPHYCQPSDSSGDTVTTVVGSRGDQLDVPRLHFSDDGSHPGSTVTVELDLHLPQETYQATSDSGTSCESTFTYLAPAWLIGFDGLHSSDLNGANPVLHLQAGGGGEDFADGTFNGTFDDGQDTWSENTTVHILHKPKSGRDWRT